MNHPVNAIAGRMSLRAPQRAIVPFRMVAGSTSERVQSVADG